jgi:ABC-type nickel/cobalt efflux system permease component RcnA
MIPDSMRPHLPLIALALVAGIAIFYLWRELQRARAAQTPPSPQAPGAPKLVDVTEPKTPKTASAAAGDASNWEGDDWEHDTSATVSHAPDAISGARRAGGTQAHTLPPDARMKVDAFKKVDVPTKVDAQAKTDPRVMASMLVQRGAKS